MLAHELEAVSPDGDRVRLLDGREIGVFFTPAVAVPARAERARLIVIENGRGASVEQQISAALSRGERRNIVSRTIGNPPGATARHRHTEMACASVTARTAATIPPRHIAPRRRGGGRPAGSRRITTGSRSPGGGDSSDPGEGEPAEGRRRAWSDFPKAGVRR
jgi:hypothetical protein